MTPNPTLSRAAAVGCLALASGAVIAGLAIAPQVPVPGPEPVDTTGRTVSVCPAAQTAMITTSTRGGELAHRGLGADDWVTLPAGRGATLPATDPVLVSADGRQSLGAAASAYAQIPQGADRGLTLARCVSPVTMAWFSGLYAGGGREGQPVRTHSELVIVNADATRADVDLRILGPRGMISAPGGRGLTIPARSTRVVALESLTSEPGALGVEVRASRGRVHTMARQRATFGALPGGSDLQGPSQAPSLSQIIPAVPGGPGERTLAITNPGDRRTTAKVEVLGRDGTFVAAQAAEVDVNAGSTTAIDLAVGLAGESAGVRITADQPIVAAALAHAATAAAASDVAAQSSAEALGQTAVGAFAVDRGVSGSVVVTNDGATDTIVTMKVVGLDGKELKAGELPVRAGTSQTWEISHIDQPGGVVVRTPKGATVHAGLIITNTAGPGLATAPLSVPEPPAAAADPQHDPGLGQGR